MEHVCVKTDKPQVAFEEFHETWTSPCGNWRVEARVESVESHPKYKARTVTIYRKNAHTGSFYDTRKNPHLRIPAAVLNKYDTLVSLAREVR